MHQSWIILFTALFCPSQSPFDDKTESDDWIQTSQRQLHSAAWLTWTARTLRWLLSRSVWEDYMRKKKKKALKPCTGMRLQVYCKHTERTWRHIYTTRILISAPVINPLVRIKCMTGKRRRAVKEREVRRKMCNGRWLRCGKCLIHGGAVQYVVHNTIFAALHQWTIFQNILECIHHLLSDYIISTEQFLCRSITIIIPQSASEWCWRIWCRVVSLYVALEWIKNCNDINLKTVVLFFSFSQLFFFFFVFYSFTTPAQENICFTY